jgi:hypothetical protein
VHRAPAGATRPTAIIAKRGRGKMDQNTAKRMALAEEGDRDGLNRG